MKGKILMISILAFSVLFADETSITGSFNLKERMNTKDSMNLSWNEAKLLLDIESLPSDNLRFFGEVRISDFGTPYSMSPLDLQKREGLFWDIREAYFDVYDFLIDNLDLRAGKQIISWGTADKTNPTSNLSPYNFEDIVDFGKKEGITGIKLTYSGNNFTLEGDFVPRFRWDILPRGDIQDAFMNQNEFTSQGMNIVNTNVFLNVPDYKISKGSELGAKLSTTIGKIDLSLSYFNGVLGLPLIKGVNLTPLDTFGNVNLSTTLSYARTQVVGSDFSTSLFGIGLWGEGALYIPDEFITEISYPTRNGVVMEYDTVLNDPFFKFVIGGDYHFKHGYYLNMQYVHGFLHEYGDSLKDYVVGRVEKELFNDKLKIVPISGLLVLHKNIKDTFSFAYMPEIEYKPYDCVSLKFGAFIYTYKNLTFFPGIDKKREVYLNMKIDF